jgi:hypothetical protein
VSDAYAVVLLAATSLGWGFLLASLYQRVRAWWPSNGDFTRPNPPETR